MTLAENSESQISEVKRAEICWTNYPRSVVIVTLAESKLKEVQSARGINETQALQTQCSNVCKLN
jgi:hypothetical protein